MPRIRTIKPEIWDSPDFMALDAGGELAFVALVSLADDEGRLRTDAGHLHLVALRRLEPEQIEAQLAVMESLGMIERYEVAGRAYVQLTNWTAHQKVDHPSASKHPEPPLANPRESSRKIANDREDSRGFENSRARADRIEDQGKEGIGEETSDLVRCVFAAWRTSLPLDAKRELTEPRRKAIRGALARASVEDCCDAVRGWRWDDWTRRPQVNDVTDCLRPANLERFRDWERGVNRPQRSSTMPGPPESVGPTAGVPESSREATAEEAERAATWAPRLKASIEELASRKILGGKREKTGESA